ncbi:MAG: acyloxyacyl hydrolase [Acidobacteria bacterium]|nr:acyloxyacyl hydrolase [Acidobacteriota bacterium]
MFLPRRSVVLAVLLAVAGTAVSFGADKRFDASSRTRGLAVAWGHSWTPGFGKTRTDIAFAAFQPRMGWFVTDRLELFGEGTLLVYHLPEAAISAGLEGIAGRYYFWNDRSWVPYITTGAGLLWTSLNVREIDRIFNFQLFVGAGLRYVPDRGPGWIVELRNHHISNANTAGTNFGINAATGVFGWEWVLR